MRRRDAGLHVARAAAVHAPVARRWARTPPAAAPTTSVWPQNISERPPPVPRSRPTTLGRPGRGIPHVDLEPGRGHPRGHDRRHGRLARAARLEAGVRRVGGDQLRQQLRSTLMPAPRTIRARSAAPRAGSGAAGRARRPGARSRRSPAVRPSSATGWLTTVTGGCTSVVQSRSSNPTRATSAGMRRPSARAARSVPTVMKLLAVNTAVGRSGRSSRRSAAASPSAWVGPPIEIRPGSASMPAARSARR